MQVAVALSTLAACGGDDVTSPTYPDVVGTYDVGVAFNGVALVGAGTLTITTSKLGVLTGDADLVITGGAQPVRQTGVVSGTMTRLGFVQFGLAPSGP